jgi:hypothetical protein
VRSDVLKEVNINIAVFWVVTPCGFNVGSKGSEGTVAFVFRLEKEECSRFIPNATKLHGFRFQKTVIWSLRPERARKLTVVAA